MRLVCSGVANSILQSSMYWWKDGGLEHILSIFHATNVQSHLRTYIYNLVYWWIGQSLWGQRSFLIKRNTVRHFWEGGEQVARWSDKYEVAGNQFQRSSVERARRHQRIIGRAFILRWKHGQIFVGLSEKLEDIQLL
ncbi:hypothetical protein PVK06_024963 [Gossypium arboreum]|uniref:Uncharacterized protein n=1 Tax=Gossypium arboreum TaxID=29729 RepID=A0ABR0PFR8_GOSAR|nr:hypothetical protein PVK06_024963 [Gossypium arboreum]